MTSQEDQISVSSSGCCMSKCLQAGFSINVTMQQMLVNLSIATLAGAGKLSYTSLNRQFPL